MDMEFKAHSIVLDYIQKHLDKSDNITEFGVYTVWKCKALQNWKFLISSTLLDGMYYEVTFNGDKSEWYLDAYKKIENQVIPEQTKRSEDADTPQTDAEIPKNALRSDPIYKVIVERALTDTPQTEETCERCVYVRGSQWCQGCNGTPKRWDGEKIVDTPQADCDTCRHYKLACELFSEVCKYEPKDKPQTERNE